MLWRSLIGRVVGWVEPRRVTPLGAWLHRLDAMQVHGERVEQFTDKVDGQLGLVGVEAVEDVCKIGTFHLSLP